MKRVLNLVIALMAVLVLGSCAEKKSCAALQGDWTVVSVGDLEVPDSVGAFVGFNMDEQLVYGFTGCNHLTGSLPAEVDLDSPLFAAIGSTRKFCSDMTVENALLPALGQVVDFKVEGDTLFLLDAAGAVVVLLQKR